MTEEKDFLDEIIEESTRKNPDFPALLDAVERRRKFQRHLAAERVKAGLSQTQVAARMETSQSAVSRLESGEANPTLSTLEHYAIAIGKRISWSIVDQRSADASAA